MSEDVDKICRALLIQARMTTSYEDLVTAIEAIAGEHNIGIVDKALADRRNKNKSE